MSLAEELTAIVGPDRVLTDQVDLYLYGTDSSIDRGPVAVVVFPESASEAAAIVKVANKHDLPIVPRGAGTGLAGGAIPIGSSIVMSMTRMNTISDVDPVNMTARVGPGVINLDLSKHTAPLGVHYAPDPSSQSVCTIGGNIANNSGGPHCLAEGTTVEHILEVELVTADGDIVVLGGAAPDPIGLDLRAVVVGSEGTMGVVTSALVRLTPDPIATRTVLAMFDSVEDAAGAVSGIIARGVVPAALEMMDQVMTIAVENFVGAGFDVDAKATLLAEVTGHDSAVDAELEIVREVCHEHHATDVRVAASEAERAKLWLGRKSAFGAVAQMAPDYYLHDTVVPRPALAEVMAKVYGIAEKYDITMMNVFHAGDGNLHPLMAFDASEPGMLDRVHAAAAELVEVCVAAGGSLSGEHGVAIEKRDLMPLVFNEYDLDAQARLREAFDPFDRFNPGKTLPEGSRCFDFGRPIPEGTWV